MVSELRAPNWQSWTHDKRALHVKWSYSYVKQKIYERKSLEGIITDCENDHVGDLGDLKLFSLYNIIFLFWKKYI